MQGQSVHLAVLLASLVSHVAGKGVAMMGHAGSTGETKYVKPCHLMDEEDKEECEANKPWDASDIPWWLAPLTLVLILVAFGLLIARICWVRNRSRRTANDSLEN
eukprot:GFUD01041932.1.p1 GENE.GFUD01041932.1~~GFUD01041932.1.p1  ORF type:complete len:105 (-),score=22.53 GFUD01041932.1:42-356(-)